MTSCLASPRFSLCCPLLVSFLGLMSPSTHRLVMHSHIPQYHFADTTYDTTFVMPPTPRLDSSCTTISEMTLSSHDLRQCFSALFRSDNTVVHLIMPHTRFVIDVIQTLVWYL